MTKLKGIALMFTLLGSLSGCQKAESGKASSKFTDREQAKIEAHKAILVKAGRMDKEYGDAFIVLGRYGWHGDGSGYFGAYSFSEESFRQAQRGWFLHGKVLEGSNELWTGSGTIKFDASIIGYSLPGMSMSWVEKGEYKHEWFTAKIIGVKGDGRTAVLDKRPPHHAEQWGMAIVPADWKDLCNCTNNFHPPFVDGRPVVESLR